MTLGVTLFVIWVVALGFWCAGSAHGYDREREDGIEFAVWCLGEQQEMQRFSQHTVEEVWLAELRDSQRPS